MSVSLNNRGSYFDIVNGNGPIFRDLQNLWNGGYYDPRDKTGGVTTMRGLQNLGNSIVPDQWDIDGGMLTIRGLQNLGSDGAIGYGYEN